MKTYNEMVDSLLERRTIYTKTQERKKKLIMRTASGVCCFALAVLIGLGTWQSNLFNQSSTSDISNNNFVKPNVIIDTDKIGNGALSNKPDTNTENKLPVISAFGSSKAMARYATPKNGEYYFSIPLRGAMKRYNDDEVLYHVYVDVFCDEDQLSSDSAQVKSEINRLKENGYNVVQETIFDGTSDQHYFTIYAKLNELTNFMANDNYGYFFFLYDERVQTN